MVTLTLAAAEPSSADETGDTKTIAAIVAARNAIPAAAIADDFIDTTIELFFPSKLDKCLMIFEYNHKIISIIRNS